MSTVENVSRRRFLTGGVIAAGALVLGVRFYSKLSPGDRLPHDTNADHATLHPSVYLGIDPDGTVWIVASRSEMGTTSRTTLPLVVADELDADWKRVKIEQAIGDKRYGDQNTDGSHSIRSYFDAMRIAGASARFMLIQAAANGWNVPASECSAASGVITHKTSGRTTTFGKVADAAGKLEAPKEVQLKDPKDWKIAGKPIKRLDTAPKLNGSLVYAIDLKQPGMLCAAIKDGGAKPNPPSDATQ